MSVVSTIAPHGLYASYLAATAQTLLPENLANLITAISLATRFSLRTSAVLMEALLESAKYSTSLGLGLSRQALIIAVSSAKRLHLLKYGDGYGEMKGLIEDGKSNGSDQFLQILDKYTNLGVYIIHHTFSLAELFAMSGFQLTSQTVKTGFRAAEESVRLIDGLFGSNETSRALASIIALVRREMSQDDSFELSRLGRIAVLTGLTKALTAFALAQNVTHNRFMREVKQTKVWEGVVVLRKERNMGMGVVVDRSDEDWVEVNHITNKEEESSEENSHTNIIEELETILADGISDETGSENGAVVIPPRNDINGPNGKVPPSMFEVTTTTRTTTVKTTTIRPILDSKNSRPAFYPPPQALTSTGARKDRDLPPGSKTVVVRSDVEEHESFRATLQENNNSGDIGSVNSDDIDEDIAIPKRGKRSAGKKFKFTLTSVTNKLKKKKVVREEYLERSDSGVAGLSSTVSNHKKDTSMTHSRTTTTSMQVEQQQNQQHFDDPEELMPGSFAPRTKKDDKKSNFLKSIKFPKFGEKSTPMITNGNPDENFHDGGPINRKASSKSGGTSGVYGHNRKWNQSVTSIASVAMSTMTTTTTTRNNEPTPEPSPLSLEPNPKNYPSGNIVKNISRFMRYASAAYGDSFMRILGIGSLKDQVFPSTASIHPNHHAFSHHTGIPMDDILLSSYSDETTFKFNHPQMHALVHYVNLDHEKKCVVVTCRGTLGLSDVLTDLTCDYEDIEVPGEHGGNFRAHAGMLGNAQMLTRPQAKVFKVVNEALNKWKDYGLVLCGHSLGAGVASLLAVLWSEPNPDPQGKPFIINEGSGLPAGRPIHCYGYGTPSVMSLELSQYCGKGLVTSVVHAYDIVASLSLGLLKDFKNVAVSLYEEKGVAEEIMGRVVGVYKRRMHDSTTEGLNMEKVLDHAKEEEEEDIDQAEADWFWSIIKTMRADMKSEKLYPPCTLYHIEANPTVLLPVHAQAQRTRNTQNSKTKEQASMDASAYKVTFTRCDSVEDRFSEIIFARSMFSDHNPRNYGEAIELLEEGIFGDGRV